MWSFEFTGTNQTTGEELYIHRMKREENGTPCRGSLCQTEFREQWARLARQAPFPRSQPALRFLLSLEVAPPADVLQAGFSPPSIVPPSGS